MATRAYIVVITLYVNGLNAPPKGHRLAGWIQKQDPYLLPTRLTSDVETHTV